MFHLGTKDYIDKNFTSMLSGAFLAIDMFFVVSGFLITRQIVNQLVHKNHFSLKEYFTRRAKRILPLLFTTLLFFSSLNYFILSPQKFLSYAKDQLSTLLFFANYNYLFQRGYFKPNHQDKILGHTWSLSIEEQFYIFTPFFLLIIYRLFGAKKLFISLGIITLISFLLYYFYDIYSDFLNITFDDQTSPFYYSTVLRFYEFGLGGLVSFFTFDTKLKFLKEIIVGTSLFFLLYLVSNINNADFLNNHYQVYICILTSIILLSPKNLVSDYLLSNKLMTFVGQRCYSIYILWNPVIALATYIIADNVNGLHQIIVLIIFILLSLFAFKYIEYPFRYKLSNKFVAKYIISSGLLILGLSILIIFTDGLGTRLSGVYKDRYFNMKYEVNSYFGINGCDSNHCTINKNSKKTVFIIGDSFSSHLIKGIETQLPDVNIISYEDKCNLFSLNWIIEEDHDSPNECLEKTESLINKINEIKPYLIIARRWGILHLKSKSDNKKIKVLTNNDIEYKKFVAREISELKSKLNVKNLLIVTNPPTLPITIHSLDQCLLSPIRKYYYPENCNKFMPMTKIPIEHMVMENFDKYVNSVQVLDPFKAFCRDGKCQLFSNEGFYFSDTIHLSNLGSEVFTKFYNKELETFINK